MRPGLTLGMSILAFIRLFGGKIRLQQMFCGNNIRVESLDVILDDQMGYMQVLING